MFVQVKLLNSFPEPLLYKVPTGWDTHNLVGTLVQVPLRNRKATALVIQSLTSLPVGTTFAVKEVLEREPLPNDPYYLTFIQHLAHYYQTPALHFIERIAHFVTHKKPKKSVLAPSFTPAKRADQENTLTEEQQAVVTFVHPYLVQPAYTPVVLHGITGSGKTEVYKKLIVQTIALGKSVILLLPEVTLALQFERLLRHQLPTTIPMYSFHSATSIKNKRLLWQKLISAEPVLIIGVHLPILTPLADLGLIIVDEEHEIGYQEKKHPKVNTKEAALWRAKLAGIPIILGSATPSIASLYNVRTKGWHFFQLKKRFSGALPTIQTVLLTDKKKRPSFWISNQLRDAIADRLSKKEQVILFLNRRGFSFFVQCKQCSFIFNCVNCSVSLTLHANNALSCHYCALQTTLPACCPSCTTPASNFIKKGIGTQQLVTIIASLFPQARIGRADMDITAKKELWQETVKDFEQGALDILIGTQTITKGFHFPRVTLVGIIWADLNLHFPVYNANETTLQQLIQVAGRAGREHNQSLVIVQSMAPHNVLQYLNEADYLQFYDHEIAVRSEVRYPPCIRFAEIELKHHDEEILEQEALRLAHALRACIATNNYSITLLGPARPPVYKVKLIFIRKMYLKADSIQTIISLFAGISKKAYKSRIFFTPNPL
jgi:primosomal protein N' (replication factor Y)